MGRMLALLAVVLLAWLGFATDGFQHGPFDDGDRTGDDLPGDLRGLDAPPPTEDAAALRGRTPRTPRAPTDDALPPPVDLDAARARGDIHGHVVRRDGTPVAGARLQILRYPWQRAAVLPGRGFHDAVPGPETLSAADGTFALPARDGARVALRV